MGLRRTVDASTEPLTRAEVQSHVRTDATEENDYLDSLIVAARNHVEQYLWRALITQTWVLTLDRFPCDFRIFLPRPPLLAVSSIVYRDTDNASQTWSSSNYHVDATAEPGVVEAVFGVSFPSTYPRPDAVTITYTAGYGAAASSVPADIKHALKLFIGHYYENREAVATGTIATELPLAARALLAPHLFRNDRVLEFV